MRCKRVSGREGDPAARRTLLAEPSVKGVCAVRERSVSKDGSRPAGLCASHENEAHSHDWYVGSDTAFLERHAIP